MLAQATGWSYPPLLADGAMGTYLQSHEAQPFAAAPPATLSLTEPERVLAAHRAYRAAGAQVVQTNSFGADRLSLEGTPWAGRVTEIARAAVALAREGADGGLVAGSVAGLARPVGWAAAHSQETRAAYAELMTALLEAGADFLLLETMSDLAAAVLAVATAVEVAHGGGRPVACTVAVAGGLRMACGCDAAAAARRLRDAGADAVGVNCGDGPATVLAAGRVMRAAVPDVPLLLQTSAGLPMVRGSATAWPLTPAGYGAFVAEARRLGAALIGGCCGTTPEHIAVTRPPSA